MPTIKDIARECNVSANTVSSVINNKQGEVSDATRIRILEAIHRLGYRPNAAARRMLGKRMNTIGIADTYSESSVSDPYKTQILGPIVHTARSMKWDVLYYSGHPNEDQAGNFPSFLDGRTDGLLCFTGSISSEEARSIMRTGLPIVFIGEPQEEEVANFVAVIDVDNEQGAYLGVSYLISLGHKRIAMFQGTGISGNRSRLEGYLRALRENNIAADNSLIYPTIAWEGSSYAYAKQIFAMPDSERPTAIFCFNDVLAYGVLQAALEHEVIIPRDMSVLGFDDLVNSGVTSPPLTTVRQPLDLIGKKAVELLIDIINGKAERYNKYIVQPELTVRSSTMAI